MLLFRVRSVLGAATMRGAFSMIDNEEGASDQRWIYITVLLYRFFRHDFSFY